MIGTTNSLKEITITGPPKPPKPNLRLAGEDEKLQGTIGPSSEELVAPMLRRIGSTIMLGRYVTVVPESMTTGSASSSSIITVIPVASARETDDKSIAN